MRCELDSQVASQASILQAGYYLAPHLQVTLYHPALEHRSPWQPQNPRPSPRGSLSCFGLSCQAVGTGLEDVPLPPPPPTALLISSRAALWAPSNLTLHLDPNQRLQDANLPHRADPHLLEPRRVQDLVPPTSTILNTHSTSKNLLFLDTTPDGRKVHALLLPPPASPNVAIVFDAQTLDVDGAAGFSCTPFPTSTVRGVHEGLKDEFNFHPLEARWRVTHCLGRMSRLGGGSSVDLSVDPVQA